MAKQQIDTIQAKDQLAAIKAFLPEYGVRAFLRTFFWILNKDGILQPFKLNRVQNHLEDRLAQNNIIGKGRQQGFTTYLLLRRCLLGVVSEGGIGSILVAQSGEYASEFFRIARRAYKYIAAVDPRDDTKNTLCQALKANLLHTQYSNKKELVFDFLDSKIRIESAEKEEAGQGMTLHHILADEYARWPGKPDATLANIRGALVKGGTVDKSSTANGAAGPYWEDFMRAMNTPVDSDAVMHWYGWWMEDGYELDLTEAQKDEMIMDLDSDELKLIARMRQDLEQVVYIKAA